ncbi:NDP-sugar synthase [Myxococcota bacterium]|nr:NDP-sugar synthase [Myxococcota bacterium]
MLLAAGLGTRLWPLTSDRAKPAVPFLGKPLVAWCAELALRHGFDHLVVNTHHLPASIHEALAPLAARAGRGFELSFSHEEEILGTAGGLAKALADGKLRADEPVLVLNAKLFTDLDLGRVMAAHRASGAAVSMVLRPNVEREHFREVLVDGDRVTGFGKGRVPEGPAPLLFTGIHVLEPDVVRSIPLTFSDTVADTYPPLIEARRVAAHVAPEGRWWELSTLERYVGLHHRAAAEGIGPAVACSAGAVIDPGASVEGSVLWEEARVERGARVVGSVLGRGVVIPAGAEIVRSVVMRRDHVDELDGAPGRYEDYPNGQILVRLPPGP